MNRNHRRGRIVAAVTAAAAFGGLVVPRAASGSSEPGGAGIASEPRSVAGMFDLDDGLALWTERPDDEDRTGVTDDEILIGMHNPSTGPAASFAMAPLFQKLIEEVNAAGGIHGRRLVLIAKDSAGNPAQAAEVSRELVEREEVFGFLGGQLSAAHQAVAPYLAQHGVIDWGANASAAWMAEPTVSTRFAVLAPAEYEALAVGRQFFAEHPGGSIAVIYQNDDFGKAVVEPLRQVAEEAGGSIAAEISFELASSADLTAQAQQALAAEPDAIYIQSQGQPVLQVMRTVRESLGSDIPILTGYAGATAVEPGIEYLDGLTSAQTQYGHGDPGNEVVQALDAVFADENVPVEFLTPTALMQLESFVRALELAGPDLTREGLVEAAQTGFDGSWTCSVCIGPMVYGPDDHWGLETISVARWDSEAGGWEHLDQFSFETSDGNGYRDLFGS